MNSNSYAEHKSSWTVVETVDRLKNVILKAGMTIFATIDHAAGAKAIGMEMKPSVVLIYGHAKGGTPIMQAAPMAALDLPLRVLVREADDGEVVIAFHMADQMLAPYGVPREAMERIAKAQALLLSVI